VNACELFLQAHGLQGDGGPETNRESLELLGALVSVLLRREIERDTLRAVDQPVDMRRLRDMAGLIADLLKLERENDEGARVVKVRFVGETEEAAG
jgi:hypothetical protein